MFYTYAGKYIYSKYHDELAALPPVTREAELFCRTMAELPVSFAENDLLAGRYGWKEQPQFTEYSIPWNSIFTDHDNAMRQLLLDNQIRVYYGTAHTCIDYGRIVSEGLSSYAAKARRCADPLLSDAMIRVIDGVELYASRLASLALEQAENAADSARFLRMHRALTRVPMQPARDFFEGLQAVWIMHTVVPFSEKCWDSISLGRLDQYLYPLYKKSLADGESRSQLKEYLKNLYRFLDTWGDGACALNIGGMDADGHDQMNELSMLIIEVQKELRLRAPILAARLNPATPSEIRESLIDPALFCVGQPTFYNELSCRYAMECRGVKPEDAVRFSVNSCMGIAMAGEEIADMWGCTFNMHLPLEMAVNGGKATHRETPHIQPANVKAPENLEELLSLYAYYLRQLLTQALALNRKCALDYARNMPNPLLSALTEGCVEKGLDRAIGAKYNTVTVEAMGMINVGNAITAIDKLVFREKKYTLEQFIDGAKHNWENCSTLLCDIRVCGRYGTGSDDANTICRRVGELLADICEDLSFDNTYYLPSLHTLATNVGFGNKLHATLDGRVAGIPVAKNAGAANEDRGESPTELIISAAALHQERFSGGQPIDVFFEYSMLSDNARRVKIQALIDTYFKLGGLQFQVNSADPEQLRQAYENPDAYRDLIVRLGGYSVRFVDLGRNVQEEFITAASGAMK